MRLSHVHIKNFRNFGDCQVNLGRNVVLLGENKAGKSNFLEALRLVLDPSLSDADRTLSSEDFWDGVKPFGLNEISVAVQFSDFADEEDPNYLALSWLSDECFIEHTPKKIAQLTYSFYNEQAGTENPNLSSESYTYKIYPGNDRTKSFNVRGMRRDIPLIVIRAIRDIATDNQVWARSPLNRLVALSALDPSDLEGYAKEIKDVSDRVIHEQAPLKTLENEIEQRVNKMIGQLHNVEPRLGLTATNAQSLLKALRLFVDGSKGRSLERTSLGLQNVLYLALLSLLLNKQQVRRSERNENFFPIVALEEPEAHLHPHLLRLVFSDFLAEALIREQPIFITSHSPHLVTSAALADLVVLRDNQDEGTLARSTVDFIPRLSKREQRDLARFLDITKAEMLFSKAVAFVEGDVEVLLLTEFAKFLGINLDEHGITVCNVYGVHFEHVTQLAFHLDIPFAVFTDGDRYTRKKGLERGVRLMRPINVNSHERLEKLLNANKREIVHRALKRFGIFVNDWTLEVELIKCGFANEMKTCFEALGEEISVTVEAGSNHIDSYLADPTKENMEAILVSIADTRWGKGRFAHRLAAQIQDRLDRIDLEVREGVLDVRNAATQRYNLVPPYMREGLQHLVMKSIAKSIML